MQQIFTIDDMVLWYPPDLGVMLAYNAHIWGILPDLRGKLGVAAAKKAGAHAAPQLFLPPLWQGFIRVGN